MPDANFLNLYVGYQAISGFHEKSHPPNEVPKAGGGTYWTDDCVEDRDYRRGYDSNDKRKKEILAELITALGCSKSIDDAMNEPKIRDSQFMDALEYGRIVHAEMSAISDAARNGRAIKNATLYCTTFPCHMCAKHIIASGINKVVFLEPYPKSLASPLHTDSISIEESDRGIFKSYPSVDFHHFFGITPRRYRELFERVRRKGDDGKFIPFGTGKRVPIIDIKEPFYAALEETVIKKNSEILSQIFQPEGVADVN